MECVRRAVWGMLYADDACIVSRSPQGLERMMVTLVDVFSAFGITVSEKKTEPMSLPIPYATATPIVFTTTGQQYRQTTSFVNLGGAITESSKLSAEIDRRICTGWMSFNRYRAELYDRPTALIRMDNRRLPRRLMLGILENPGRGGRGGKEKELSLIHI